MFTELLPLLKGRTLLLTIAQMENGLIRLNIIPKCLKESDPVEKALTTPLSVTGSAADLDRELSMQLSGFTTSILGTGSTLAQVQEAHRAAIKDIEAENKRALDNKRKTPGSKPTETAQPPTPDPGPIFPEGKPVFGSKHSTPQPVSLFEEPAALAPVQEKLIQDEEDAAAEL